MRLARLGHRIYLASDILVSHRAIFLELEILIDGIEIALQRRGAVCHRRLGDEETHVEIHRHPVQKLSPLSGRESFYRPLDFMKRVHADNLAEVRISRRSVYSECGLTSPQ